MDMRSLPSEPGGTASSMIDLQDSEILIIEGVLAKLHERAGHDAGRGATAVNYDAWQREAIDRFGEAGFKIDVRWYDTNMAGVLWPEINILARLTGQFDPDKQVHEVTRDLLGLGEGGVIKSGLDHLGN